MHTFRLVYCSQSTAALTDAALKELVAASRARNAAAGVGGALLYRWPGLVQALEGSRAAVSRTLERIVRDPRHVRVTVLDARHVPAPLFPGRPMVLVPAPRLPLDVLARVLDESLGGSTRIDAEVLLNLIDAAAAAPGPLDGSGVRPLVRGPG
jgi:hypothetical protein